MKKIKALVVAFAISLFLPHLNTYAYSDISEDSIWKPAIEFITNEGIAQGFSDGSFRPMHGITRAELTKILVNTLFPNEVGECKQIYFQDVNDSDKFYQYICVAQQKNIVHGYSDGTFRPNAPISHAHALKIISNSYGYTTGKNEINVYAQELANRNALPKTFAFSQYANLYANESIQRSHVAKIIYNIENNLADDFLVKYGIDYNYGKEYYYRFTDKFSIDAQSKTATFTRDVHGYDYYKIAHQSFVPNTNDPIQYHNREVLTFPISESIYEHILKEFHVWKNSEVEYQNTIKVVDGQIVELSLGLYGGGAS
jgi:hypothetical protein